MKRVRCPKCDSFITFDETQYTPGETLVFECHNCGKQFRIRLGVSKVRKIQDEEDPEEEAGEAPFGSIVVIESNYHYKQVIPLHIGKNVIGRYMKGNPINCPIETGDLTMDMTHCIINVSRDKHDHLKYVLRDGPSNHGTFVNGERLPAKEQRTITDGTVFNIGATTVILKALEAATGAE